MATITTTTQPPSPIVRITQSNSFYDANLLIEAVSESAAEIIQNIWNNYCTESGYMFYQGQILNKLEGFEAAERMTKICSTIYSYVKSVDAECEWIQQYV